MAHGYGRVDADKDSCRFLLAGYPSSPPIPPRRNALQSQSVPETLSAAGGRTGTGFLPGIQKPAPVRLIRPYLFNPLYGFAHAGAPQTCELPAPGGVSASAPRMPPSVGHPSPSRNISRLWLGRAGEPTGHCLPPHALREEYPARSREPPLLQFAQKIGIKNPVN